MPVHLVGVSAGTPGEAWMIANPFPACDTSSVWQAVPPEARPPWTRRAVRHAKAPSERCQTWSAMPRAARRPEKRQPPRKVPSSER